MTQRNNTRFKVVFLIALIFSLISACTLPSANNQDNRPSSQNEDNEERQPQATATSLPTHTATKTPWPTKTQPPLPTKTEVPTATSLPSPTATATGNLYFNNFDQMEDSGPHYSVEHAVWSEFKDGALTIHIEKPSHDYSLITFEENLTTAMMTAWIRFDTGADTAAGYFCQQVWDENEIGFGYVFLISSTGDFSLVYRSTPTEGDETIIETIITGNTSVLNEPGPNVYNSIQAACIDDRLMFFVNGETLIDVRSTRPVQAGTVGLVTSNGSDSENAIVTWDMLSVDLP